MVTEKIGQAGYMFFSAGASVQAENKSQFANAMENAEKSYSTENKPVDKSYHASEENADAKLEENLQEKSEIQKDENVSKENTVEEKKPLRDSAEVEKEQEISEVVVIETMANVMVESQVEVKVQQMIADELGVSLESIQESMLNLGLTVDDLQDPQNMLKLIVETMELQGPEEMLTNPQLTEAFKKLNQSIENFMAEASAEESTSFDMTGEKVNEMNSTDDGFSQEEDQNNNADAEHVDAKADGTSGDVQKFAGTVSTMKTDFMQNIQELLVERVDTETATDIVRQVVDQVKFQMRTDVNSLEMQLYPEHLGKVSIQVVSKNGVMTAQIAAENEVAKVALESQIQTLKENFEQQGLKVESVEVMVSTRGFEQNEGKEQNASESERQGKQFRRIRSLDSVDDEVIEETEEMKEVLGSTVSYMA